jgi:hypothetical protein
MLAKHKVQRDHINVMRGNHIDERSGNHIIASKESFQGEISIVRAI